MAFGSLKPFHKPPENIAQWSVLDLLICPLERMNDYCQFARELDSPAYSALSETRRLLTKSIMRRSNTRLLREIDTGLVDLQQTLVDVRRWMIRSSPLVVREFNSKEDRLVHAFLFSDQLILARGISNNRWVTMKILYFHDKQHPLFVRECREMPVNNNQNQKSSTMTRRKGNGGDEAVADEEEEEEERASPPMLNPSTPLGDSRFWFEIGVSGSSEEDTIQVLMPNLLSSTISYNLNKQIAAFWNRLGLVAFEKETGCAVGPGGFSNVDSQQRRGESSSTFNDRSRDMKRKQQLKLEWMSDIARLIKIWNGSRVDVCWLDDVLTLNLINQKNGLHNTVVRVPTLSPTSSPRATNNGGGFGSSGGGPTTTPSLMRSESVPT